MLIVIGIVLIAIGGGLMYMRQQSLNTAMDIKYYETSPVVDVVDTYNQLKDELGVGNYSGNIVEVIGQGIADNPLTAEHSKRDALYYEAKITREYEVTVESRDKDGNLTRNRERRTETVADNTQYVPFYVNDGSGGQILVDMQGAKKDTIESFDKFEREAPSGFNISFGGSNSKTIGYRYSERIIPNNTKLYVLGEVSDRRGELSIIKPSEKGKPFIVSTKSEDELIKSAESSAKWSMIGAIVLAITGVAMIIGSFFQ